MAIPAQQSIETTSERGTRKDPAGFVVVIVMALFAVTALAVVTMQLAIQYNWQLF